MDSVISLIFKYLLLSSPTDESYMVLLTSFCLFGQVLLELVLCTLLCVGQVLKQSHNVVLQQPKAFRSADRDLVLLHFLQLVDAIADIHPAASAGVLDDRIRGIFFRRHLVDRLSVAFNYLASVARPDSSCEHRGMRADGDVSNWEQIVLGVIIGVDVDFSSGDEDERRIDVDGEFDVSVLVSV